jgi:hypothetical protein
MLIMAPASSALPTDITSRFCRRAMQARPVLAPQFT